MYETVRRSPAPTMGDLGAISIPDWLKGIAGLVLKGKQVAIPTPTGTVTVDLDNPAQLAALYSLLKGTKITTAAPALPAAPRGSSFVDQIPGGWLTVGLVGLGVFMLVRRGR